MKGIRNLAMLLASSMIVSMVPMGAFAEDDGFTVVDEAAVSDYSIAEETAIDAYSIDEDYGDLYAAATAWPATKNIKTYAKSTKNNTKVYKTAKSTDGSYGTIYASDLITINGYDNGRYYVTYPISGGTKKGYVAASDITSSAYNVAKNSFKASGKITTYRRSGGGAELGYISKGDNVYRIATSGDYTQVIYPISGGYKMGWIYESPTPKNEKTNKSLADIASSEIGYQGTGKNGKGQGDYTKYGKWFGNNGVAWCAIFVSWCVNQAGESTKIVPKKASCNDMKSASNSYKKWSSNALSNIKKNDVIFFSTGSQDSHHVGIVYSVSGSKITVIEGNTSSDQVKKNTYTVDSKTGKITKGWSGHYFCGYISVD